MFPLLVALLSGIFVSVATSSAQAAPVGGKRAAILVPFSGGGSTLGSNTLAGTHNAPFYGNTTWGTDLHAGQGVAVQARFQSSDGAITLNVINSGPLNCAPSSGGYVQVKVSVDGTEVGRVVYEHLANMPAFTNGQTITVGDTLGTLNRWSNSTCWQVNNDGGIHTHVEAQRSCYRSLAASTSYSAATAIGMLSSNYATGNISVCDEADVTSVMSASSGGSTNTLGNFNGDSFDDIAILHQLGDGGADAHVLFGAVQPFGNTSTQMRNLPGSSGWDWSKMKLASGNFNGDSFSDVAIVHQRGDGGADVHVLYGGTSPFSFPTTITRQLPGSSSWDWSKMKLASGNFNGDSFDDIAIVHQLGDGGADAHVLFGAVQPFGNTNTQMRNLPGSSSWDWSKMKLASGNFNGDGFSDVAIVHQRGDGGADVHVLYGGTSPFSFPTTITRQLPGSSSWDWSKMKLASGNFNGDSFDDIAILHQLGTDDSADVHVLYGSAGTPFGYNPTFARHLPAASGWSWSKMKLASGNFNGDGFSDVGIVHQVSNDGAAMHILYGSVGTPFQFNPTLARNLPASSGWAWSKMKLATTSQFSGS